MALQSAVATDQQERELVTFKLAEQEFGLSIMSVQEIVRMPGITRIPRAPSYVNGISNLRGNVLPVINTRLRFSMEEAEATDRTRVVVVDIEGKNIGMVVDAVSEVLRVENEKIDPPPEVVSGGVDAAFLEGVVKLDSGKRLVMLLNPNKVCEVELDTNSKSENVSVSKEKKKSETDKTIDEEQFVTFSLVGEEYGLDIQQVKEIIRVPELIKVPQAPDYVEGLISLRNRLMPLIDLRRMFKQTLVENERNAIVEQILEIKKASDGWEADLKELLQEEQEEDVTIEIQPYAVEDTDISFSSDLERVKDILEKTINLAKNVDSARQQMASLPFTELKTQAPAKLLTPVNRVKELLDQAVEETKNNDEQRVVVTEAGGITIGLVVDSVNEVMRFSKELIDLPPNVSEDTEKMQIKGVAKLDQGKRLIMLLDNQNLVDVEELGEISETSNNEKESAQEGDETRSLKQQALEEEQLVTFRLDKEEFGIPIMQIQEINRLEEITKVPRTPEFVAGVTNLRGTVVPVIDLRNRFGMELKEADEATRVIIIDLQGKKTGLIVDQVHEVRRILKSEIEPPPDVVSADKVNEFIDGIGKLDQGKRMLVLLNVDRILNQSEQEKLKTIGDAKPKKKPAKIKLKKAEEA